MADGIIMDSNSILGTLKQLNSKIEEIKAPNGLSKKTPARSCLDLYLTSEAEGAKLRNGNYWVDPNAGSEIDAIEVYCNFDEADSVQTCVYPTTSVQAKSSYSRGFTGVHQWWSEMDLGNLVSYDPQPTEKVDRADYTSQVTFLRLLSSNASQRVTYLCDNHEADIKLRGTGHAEFDINHPAFTVVSNNCASDRSNGKAVIEVSTSKTSHMPIRDIATLEVGEEDKDFGFEIQPVCFSA